MKTQKLIALAAFAFEKKITAKKMQLRLIKWVFMVESGTKRILTEFFNASEQE